MDDALTIAVQAMHNNMQRLTTISHNVANAATAGYKRSVPVSIPFAQALSNAEAGRVATGAARLETTADTRAGMAVYTGQPLDLFVEGDAYLELSGSAGPGLARSGRFRVDPSGKLVNEQGAALASLSAMAGLSADSITVRADGAVLQDGRTIGTIRLVPGRGLAMTKGPDGLMRPTQGALPSGSDVSGQATIRAGYIEKSNVSTGHETIMLMETSRSFEALSRFVSSYNEHIGTAIQKLGEF
jgi:flagellar basal-body rod protein FlgF